MPNLIVPGSWHNVTGGRGRMELGADTLDGLLRALVAEYPEAAYRLYSPSGALLRYHVFIVDGEQVQRAAPPDEVRLDADSIVEIIPPLSGG